MDRRLTALNEVVNQSRSRKSVIAPPQVVGLVVAGVLSSFGP